MFVCDRIVIKRMALKLIRNFHLGRVVPDIDPELAKHITGKEINLKKVPTRLNRGLVRLPAILEAAAQVKIRQVADSKFRSEVKQLLSIMYNLKKPDDSESVELKRGDVKTELELRDKIKNRPEHEPSEFKLKEDIILAQDVLKNMIMGKVEQRRRDWRYYEYDEYASNLYMATRLPANYASIKSVMNEIKALDPSFNPNSVLDYGSGMGTTTWAVEETWPNTVSEFCNIDLSKEQQYLCEFLLREGSHFGQSPNNVFHRQYLPTSNRVKYDLVVAAYSMLELPTPDIRVHTIENLWNKTNDLLVLIERGNHGGFSLIDEARGFILDMCGHDVTSKKNLSFEKHLRLNRSLPTGHILGPCAHEFTCPRAQMPCKKMMDVCRFRTVYEPLNCGEIKSGFITEQFSYVILRKGPHPSYFEDNHERWPRAIERKKRKSGQIIHKLCCPTGELAEVIFTKKKYGQPLYEVAKSCDWGDILPIKVKDTYRSKSSFIRKEDQGEDVKSIE